MDRTDRFSRLAGGISIGSVRVTAGTLSGVFTDIEDGKPVLVSNWHVFVGDPGKTPIVQPGQYDGGRDPVDRVGILKRYVPLDGVPTMPWWKRIICFLFGWLFPEWCKQQKMDNYVDAACATFAPATEGDRELVKGVYMDDGSILYPKNTHPGDNIKTRTVWKVGRTTGYTEGMVIFDNATVRVWYGTRYYVFKDQIVVRGTGRPGDSGSPVFLMKGEAPSEDDAFVGLLYAGSTDLFVVCKYKWIKSLLKVRWE
jgi:hypothetical protein